MDEEAHPVELFADVLLNRAVMFDRAGLQDKATALIEIALQVMLSAIEDPED
jgi:hypothetical protein